MDANVINPFLNSLMNVLPMLGMTDIKRGQLSLKSNVLESKGVMVNIGVIGDLKGNIVYGLELDGAKKIASMMMMGMEVKEFDEMAQSAIQELSNMLSANAATGLSEMGLTVDISTPTLIYGVFNTLLKGTKVICIEMLIHGIQFDINVAIDKS